MNYLKIIQVKGEATSLLKDQFKKILLFCILTKKIKKYFKFESKINLEGNVFYFSILLFSGILRDKIMDNK